MAQNDLADAPGEADEQLKKRARRRLVGAVALVLFAVILLPMVMDHEPRPNGPEIQVRIPSRDAPAFEGRVPPAKTSKQAKVESAEVAPALPIAEKPLSLRESKPESKQIETREEAKTEAKVERKPEPKASDSDNKKPVSAEASRAANVLAGGSGNDQWVVQLGAYRETGRVKLLTGKIKELGLPVFTEKVDTPQGQRTRVRAGPFSSRDAAVKAQERVKIIGVSGPVAQK